MAAYDQTVNQTLSTGSVASDQRKMVAAKLLIRQQLRLVAQSICEKQKQEKGTGTQFTLIRYARMNVPTVTLTEGVTPSNSSITVETVTGTMDQWGDVITITDVARLTTLHPLAEIATQLLGDNAQRVIDREVQVVMMNGTNVTYGDASVASRALVTIAMTVTDSILLRAKIVMGTNGAPLRSGPSNMKSTAAAGSIASNTLAAGAHYVAVGGLEISADIMRMAATVGLWQSVNQYQRNGMAIYTAEVGTYLNFRIVETNFIPRFRRFGNATTVSTLGANAAGITGLTIALSAGTGNFNAANAYAFKITRKNLQRGFEEDISIIHTQVWGGGGTGGGTFTFPATAGFTYALYFDKNVGGLGTTDADLVLINGNIAAAGVITLNAIQATGAAPPPSTNATGPVDSIYPLYILGAECLMWTGLQDLQVLTTGTAPDKSDPLGQRSTIGYKFMAKTAIMNQLFLMRLELASSFNI